jgi:arylsulfatase A-like enzyme
MPTVLQLLGEDIPDGVEGRSLTSIMRKPDLPGRDFTVSSIPFANSGDYVRSVDNTRRQLWCGVETTLTTEDWSLLYTTEPGMSELYHLPTDPKQERNIIREKPEIARELHRVLVGFMRETNVAPRLLEPRLTLRL